MKKFTILLLLSFPVPVVAQEVAPQPITEPSPIVVGMHVGGVPSGYNDGGRRDPFSALIAPKRAAGRTGETRPRAGLAGLAVSDVVVRGIIRNGSVMVAILEAPGKQSFVARVKDKLLDAVVQSIDAGGVVFAEQSMAGPANQVRRALRSAGDTGEEDR